METKLALIYRITNDPVVIALPAHLNTRIAVVIEEILTYLIVITRPFEIDTYIVVVCIIARYDVVA